MPRATSPALTVVIGRSALQGGDDRRGLRVAGGLDALHDAVGGDDVLEEGGVSLLERLVEAVDDLVGCLRHDRGSLLGWGWGLTLSRFGGHRVPRSRVKVSRCSVRRDHRTDLIGCGLSAVGRRDMTRGSWPWYRSRPTIPSREWRRLAGGRTVRHGHRDDRPGSGP